MENKGFWYQIKQWDYKVAQWISQHFRGVLFYVLLFIILVIAFFNVLLNIILIYNADKSLLINQLLMAESINSSLIVLLLLLIALGVLNIINSNTRLRSVLKNIEYNLSKRRSDHKSQEE